MALNTQYAGTGDLALAIGGTRSRLSIGTSGTDAIHPLAAGSLIVWASDLVDTYIAPIVGTSGYGTNSAGTKGIPSIITQITARLAAANIIDSLMTSDAPNESAWSDALRKRAMELLEKIVDGTLPIPGGTTGESALPRASNQTFRVRGEKMTITGTDWNYLQFQKALPNSELVYATTLVSGTTYVRTSDYVFVGFDQGTTGDIRGAIRRVGTNIASGQDIFLDYEVWADDIFTNPTDMKTSQDVGRLAQPMTPGWDRELRGELL